MKIDFVVPWVDGNDPEWKAEKALYQTEKNNDSNSVNRFRDWGLLPYWFRAVEKYTPWVNKIYFITWGHIPQFLNTANPKLQIINHRDFIPEEYLPTFSSHAIEANIHRIKELGEYFVYFNDDTFILRPMPVTSFFRDKLPCTYGGEYPIELVGKIDIWQHAAVNDLGVINAHFDKRRQVKCFGKKYRSLLYRWQDNVRTLAAETLFPNEFTGFRNLHAPAAYLKQTFKEVWKAEPELLHTTSQCRFRRADGVNQWVFLWWQIASGNFSPAIIDNIVNSVDENSINDMCSIIESQSHDMICINDPEHDVNFEFLSEQLKKAFMTILPDKSSFEK